MLEQLLENRTGQIILSVILGMGLAIIFSRACIGRNCIVIRGPNPDVINNKIYQFNNECYKFKPNIISCEKNNKKLKTD
jgi:hypothetical protein